MTQGPVGTAGVLSGSGGWVTLHLVIVVGIFLMLLGLFALSRSITGHSRVVPVAEIVVFLARHEPSPSRSAPACRRRGVGE